MKKFNHLINPSIFKDTVGMSFKKYKCNDFVFTNSVYQIVGLYIENKIFSLDVEMRDNVINKEIANIRIINENKKIYVHSHLEYDIDLTRAIIFTLASGEEICFEKDSWIFSEEIVINRGHNLINVIASPNDFYERIAEEPNMRGKLTRTEIVLT